MRNLQIDKNQIYQQIETLRSAQSKIQNIRMHGLSVAEMARLLKDLGEITGQIKAFNSLLASAQVGGL